ncbi:hypothetical protein QYH69_05365 [Paraburkholderia sp. SARCC-3016]|uniref:hypothetical protein n=1 Tax=Paraburkholderia sp. SARCC-3016 TaxID=3058611 RepID=UPI002809EEB3|nr:hypothetical protein [Paraburkholderia sp. SARCC-3016]MDQ7976671.1 hypothetical protein [Paraburkholderia sp. SARCC-3016]
MRDALERGAPAVGRNGAAVASSRGKPLVAVFMMAYIIYKNASFPAGKTRETPAAVRRAWLFEKNVRWRKPRGLARVLHCRFSLRNTTAHFNRTHFAH